MWPVSILNRRRNKDKTSLPLFDEAFLHRLERLAFRTPPWLRGAMWGERRSRNLRPAFDFSDHRPYTSGDDLRHVDWNVYGRHEELLVKLGEATQSVNVHILLDRSRSMAWVPGRPWQSTHPSASKKWDAARRLAAALGYLGLVGGERVTITPFGDALDESFGPTRGKRQVTRALQFLSAVGPSPTRSGRTGQGGLAAGLATYARAHQEGGVLVLVSDLFDSADSFLSHRSSRAQSDDWGLAQGLRHLTPPRWHVLVMHLLTEQELQPTLEGDVDLRDLETGDHLPFRLDERTLSRYRSRVRRWCEELNAICAGRGATYSRVLAEWPFERAVIPYLQQRRIVQ